MAKQTAEATNKMHEEAAKSANDVSRFTTIETMRGEVKVFSEAGESVTGILTQKEGRVIGEGKNKVGTIEVFSTEENQLFLLPKHGVLESNINKAKEKFGAALFVKITYKGKQQGKENEYHNYKVEVAFPSKEEIQALERYEESQSDEI